MARVATRDDSRATMTIRITGGRLARRQIHVPKSGVRPTSDRAREAIFSSLTPVLRDARVLDLFAGTGALGIEALSRGALRVTFVEKRSETTRTLNENLRALGLEGAATVVGGEAEKVLARVARASFDVVFVDPPYADTVSRTFLAAIENALAPGGVLVVERSKKEVRALETALPCTFDRAYGEAWIRVYEKPSTTTAGDEISDT
jgi:16S rRNA (guanine966-N2)-methyltransferase